MMTTARRLEGIGEYYFSGKLREIDRLNNTGAPVINLGIGSPDLPPHPDVVSVLAAAGRQAGNHGYQGYKGIASLREAFARWYGVWYGVTLDPLTEVLPLMGSKEGIMHLCMTYLNEGDKALIPNPGYPTYASAVCLAGGIPVDYKLSPGQEGWPDFEQLEQSGLEGVKLMFVNYPHMPTGQPATAALFEALLTFARRHDILLIHDNPYSFILNDQPASLLALPGAKDVAVELNSLSKSHHMAGWRIGVLVAAEDRIREVLRFKSNMDSGMFLPVQQAAVKALSLGQDWFDQLNANYRERREKVYTLLNILGCDYTTGQSGMFVWARVPEACRDGYAFSDALLRQCRVFLTPGGIFGTEGLFHIRVSLCSNTDQLEEALQRIEQTESLIVDINEEHAQKVLTLDTVDEGEVRILTAKATIKSV